jgi:hypothetical protein
MIKLIKYLLILNLVYWTSACGDREEQKNNSSQFERLTESFTSQYQSGQTDEKSYVALFVCGMQSPQGIQNINIVACFSGGSNSIDTELELSNGKRYGLYKPWDIIQLGREDSEGFKIDLNSEFSIKAQNSSDTLILGLKIIDLQTGKVFFEKQVGHYGVIYVKS